jgi:ATP adenylyltransferase
MIDVEDVDDCVACSLSTGRRPLPGGLIHRSDHWLVEHCIGPLGLGALVVKPERHVTAVADLSDDEVHELGPLLRLASRVAGQLVRAEQVYNCLWSHAGGVPVHIHYVVQPVTREQMDRMSCYGPKLQVAMFVEGHRPAPSEIEAVAARARGLFAAFELDGAGRGEAGER